jgi:hypothetical protein
VINLIEDAELRLSKKDVCRLVQQALNAGLLSTDAKVRAVEVDVCGPQEHYFLKVKLVNAKQDKAGR